MPKTDKRLNAAQAAANRFRDDDERAMCRAALESVRASIDLAKQTGNERVYLAPDTLAEIDLALSMLNDFHGLSPRCEELNAALGGGHYVIVKQRRANMRSFVGQRGDEKQILPREYHQAEIAALAARVGKDVGFVAARVRTTA